MIKRIFFLFFLLPGMCFTQSESIKYINEVNDLPPELLPAGATKFGLLINDFGDPAGWGYQSADGKYHILFQLGEEFDTYWGGSESIYYSNGFITLDFQVPMRPILIDFIYSWDGKKLIFLSMEGGEDPNIEVIDSAEAAFKAGDIKRTVSWYHSVQYPMYYINEFGLAMDILSKAHQLGTLAFRNKKYKQAYEYMEDALVFYPFDGIWDTPDENGMKDFIEHRTWTDKKDSIGLWLGDYGYFLYKADSLEKSIRVNTYLNKVFPKLSGPYLQLGDALYDQGKTEDAKKVYLRYIALMKEKGREKSIPQRAYSRAR